MPQKISTNNDLRLDGDTLLMQLHQLGQLGLEPSNGGRTRIALTDSEKMGRDRLVAWMHDIGLKVLVDRIGNIFGTLHSDSDDSSQLPIMVGSHIDTVAHAGALDGSYGVLAGLAVVRAYRQSGQVPARSITVVAFTNEEGVRYQPDMMGSLVYAGGLSVDAALDTVGTDGTRLGDELARIGYAGELEPGAIVPHEYLELHVEQGPVLEAEACQIGVVENLQGISWQRIRVQGEANHAGTTPIRLRHDAGWVAASITTFLRNLVLSSGTTLATIGSIHFEPNLINVIPRESVFTVDLRDPNEEQLQVAEQRLADFLVKVANKEGVTITTEQLARFEPVSFNEGLANAIEASAQHLAMSHRRITSGAGHDAQMMARIAPAAMIFVPSRDGISHNPDEHTDDEQLIDGAQVLLDVVAHRVKIR